MGREIERKYLVVSDGWRAGAKGVTIRQGFLSLDPGRVVRVRVAGDQAFLTIKGKATGLSRPEYEYEIPVADADELLELCVASLVEKVRFEVPHEGHTWEVDEFTGDNAGLVVAELELEDETNAFSLPAWAGREVSDDHRYANVNLATRPYSAWKHQT